MGKYSGEALTEFLNAFWGEDTPPSREHPEDEVLSVAELRRAKHEEEESRKADGAQARRIKAEELAAKMYVGEQIKLGDRHVGISESGEVYRDSGSIRHYGRYAKR